MPAITILDRAIRSRGFGLLQEIAFRRRRFDGQTQQLRHEVYDIGDAAAILPYDPARGCVLLVRQFRLPVYLACGREAMIEACAGKLEGMDAARRIVLEVEEETGFAIKEPQFLFEAFMSPGAVGERLYLYLARYSQADHTGPGGGLTNEDIKVLEPRLDAALEMIESGEIIDAKTIILLQTLELSGLLAGK